MEDIKEENKYLIAHKTNYFTMLFLVASGTAGIILTGINSAMRIILFVLGIYFIFASILQIQKCSTKIEKNIERLRKWK